MNNDTPKDVFWFRRDLRLADNHGLFAALSSGRPVVPIFIFDRNILDKLKADDQRVPFIHQELNRIQKELQKHKCRLLVFYGYPNEVFSDLFEAMRIHSVHCNEDYEPYAIDRDDNISDICRSHGAYFNKYKDHVVFHKKEIVKGDGNPYSVFTPYSRTWKSLLEKESLAHFNSESKLNALWKDNGLSKTGHPIPELKAMGFNEAVVEYPSRSISRTIIKNYKENRNFPFKEGTSRLGIHFRFGTISIREKARTSMNLSDSYLNELIWRDFYSMVLFNYPWVVEGPFREKYKGIPWRNNISDFQRWCDGETGIPIVDAGMRELNETGYMHNRVRMIVASFLTKNLLINWQWGEAYFAEKLLDFELASNNGGWQWAAGTGTDAAPYFRVFNPITQQKKFDPEDKYVTKWVSEYQTNRYPEPMVDLKESRKRCIAVYKKALNQIE